MNRDQKLELLSFAALWASHGSKPYEESAQRLSRELFPPMAKPLVWRREQQSQHLANNGGYTIYESNSGSKFVARERPGATLAECNSIEVAKSACEAHHQARFLEQLA